ncbi:MAG: hypothetical protein ACKO96_04930 [Flammeovirgaceae bacterium]
MIELTKYEIETIKKMQDGVSFEQLVREARRKNCGLVLKTYSESIEELQKLKEYAIASDAWNNIFEQNINQKKRLKGSL